MKKFIVAALLLAGCAPQMQGVILKIPSQEMQAQEEPPADEQGLPPCWRDPECTDICNRGWRDVSFWIDKEPKRYFLQGNMCMPWEFRLLLGRHVIDVAAEIQTAHGPLVLYRTVYFELSPHSHPPTRVDIGFSQ